MIIGFLIAIVSVALIAKALLETILGICMIAQSVFWHSVAAVLNALALILDGYRWIWRALTTETSPSHAKA